MTEWTRERIIKLLETNDVAVGRALSALLERQTSEEQRSEQTISSNGVGFSGAHAEPMTSMAKFFRSRGYLTPKQLAWLRGKTPKGSMRIGMYAKQLLEIAQEKAA